jgi:hypothetical protein
MQVPKRSAIDILFDPLFYIPLLIGLFIQPIIFTLVSHRFPSKFAVLKVQAWLLTLLSSAIMTLGSIPLVIAFMRENRQLNTFSQTNSAFSTGICAYFISYLISDLLIGSIYYRSLIHPVSGWFHHCLYIILVFYIIQISVPGIFTIFGILEAPTFIIALGSIHPPFRSDRLFGLLFFLTRICLHVYITFKIYQGFPENYHYLISASIIPLHVMWFRGWIKSQLKAKNVKVIQVDTSTLSKHDKQEQSVIPIPQPNNLPRFNKIRSGIALKLLKRSNLRNARESTPAILM